MPFASRGGLFAQPSGPPGPVPNSFWDNRGTASTLTSVTFTNDQTTFTTSAEFGSHSLDAITAGSSIYYPNYNSSTTAGGWPTGTGDFCLEGWVWVPATRNRGIRSSGVAFVFNAGGGLGCRFGDKYRGTFDHLAIWARGQADLDVANYIWPSETWTHWAVQRKGTTITLWADGNKLPRTDGPSGTAATRSFTDGIGELSFCHYNNRGSDENLLCLLDECCISSTWRYDDTQSTYTIPDAPFEVDQYVNMIVHFDNTLSTATS